MGGSTQTGRGGQTTNMANPYAETKSLLFGNQAGEQAAYDQYQQLSKGFNSGTVSKDQLRSDPYYQRYLAPSSFGSASGQPQLSTTQGTPPYIPPQSNDQFSNTGAVAQAGVVTPQQAEQSARANAQPVGGGAPAGGKGPQAQGQQGNPYASQTQQTNPYATRSGLPTGQRGPWRTGPLMGQGPTGAVRNTGGYNPMASYQANLMGQQPTQPTYEAQTGELPKQLPSQAGGVPLVAPQAVSPGQQAVNQYRAKMAEDARVAAALKASEGQKMLDQVMWQYANPMAGETWGA